MTEKELNQLCWLKKEIKQLDKKLKKLENMSLTKNPIITELPFGNEKSDNVARYSCDIVDLQNELIAKRHKCILKEKQIEKYIDNITDSEIKQIIRLRHVEGLTWAEIGGEMSLDRRTVSRKYYKYLKDAHNAHSTCDIIQI